MINQMAGQFQEPKLFSVEILHPATSEPLGTGVIVSDRGIIVTCEHVVKEAGIKLKRIRSDSWLRNLWRYWRRGRTQEIGQADPEAECGRVVVHLRLPDTQEWIKKSAAVLGYCCDSHDDFAILRLPSDVTIEPEQIARVGIALLSERHKFRCYGFTQAGHSFPAEIVFGEITGCTTAPDGHLVDHVQLRPQERINSGMSGAGVLDDETMRNVIVGIITHSEKTFSARIAWAIDTAIFACPELSRLGVKIYDSWPLREHEIPEMVRRVRSSVIRSQGNELHNAPDWSSKWIGRKDFLDRLDDAWRERKQRIVSLIGFGGEGKTTLARQWIEPMLSGSSDQRPIGVFWWSFYANPDIKQFLEAAMQFFTGDRERVLQTSSAEGRISAIIGQLYAKRYIIVLDGIEGFQHSTSEAFGEVSEPLLRKFLDYFSIEEHQSVCVVTSRLPLMDLISTIAYEQHVVEGLSTREGVDLLRVLGVNGEEVAIESVVVQWEGHPLVLVLIAADLVRHHGGDIHCIEALPRVVAGEPHYKRVKRVLEWYDRNSEEADRVFLELFSVFRVPVSQALLKEIMLRDHGPGIPNYPLFQAGEQALDWQIKLLETSRILRADLSTSVHGEEKRYMIHPLVREFYAARFALRSAVERQAFSRAAARHYLDQAEETSEHSTLNSLEPLFEAMHHAASAAEFDWAFEIYLRKIEKTTPQSTGRILTYHLGQYAKDLDLIRQLFADGDFSRNPLVTDRWNKRYLLNEVGLCKMTLGQVSDALSFFHRSIELAHDEPSDLNLTSINYQNSAEAYIHLGTLAYSERMVEQGLHLAIKSQLKFRIWRGLGYRAWAVHLRGDTAAASQLFLEAERIHSEDRSLDHLTDLWGIWHADHLIRLGDLQYAEEITTLNLQDAEHDNLPESISQCHRVFGDLSVAKGASESTIELHYDKALEIARRITHRQVLIEALLARGRYWARAGKPDKASPDLREALEFSKLGGYRIFEVDTRIALAWQWLSAHRYPSAWDEAKAARELSQQIGYAHGITDATTILTALDTIPTSAIRPDILPIFGSGIL
ncbi:MAG: trypsin-like peptidase domain-containing protein [Methylococcales bacterium]